MARVPPWPVAPDGHAAHNPALMWGSQPFLVVAEHQAALQAAGLADLDSCLAFAAGDVVKAAIPGRDVRCVAVGTAVYYVKRVIGSGWRDILTEARALQQLAAAGVPVPVIAAVGARRNAAALVTLGLPTRQTLERVLMDTAVSPARMRRLVERVSDLLRRVHGLGINHRDFYCCHVHVNDADDVFLVDLGRAEFRRTVPWRRRVKDLAAMDFSVPGRIAGRSLRLRFLVAYLAGELGPRRRRWLLAAIAAKSRRMRRHSLRMVARGEPNIHVNT